MPRTLIIGNKNYSSWSLRAWLLLAHLGEPFEEIRISLDTPQTKARILRYGPAGKVPVLIEGDAQSESLRRRTPDANRRQQAPPARSAPRPHPRPHRQSADSRPGTTAELDRVGAVHEGRRKSHAARNAGVDARTQRKKDSAAGLQHMHESGLVHRDFKPENLMFYEGGVARLVDFGSTVR